MDTLIYEAPPADAVCLEAGCRAPATTERFVGILVPADPRVTVPGGFSELVELVCEAHA